MTWLSECLAMTFLCLTMNGECHGHINAKHIIKPSVYIQFSRKSCRLKKHQLVAQSRGEYQGEGT